jgi:phage-related minor tail protein
MVWYSERLADLSLLDAAVVAVVDRVGYLAVPVGGSGGGSGGAGSWPSTTV